MSLVGRNVRNIRIVEKLGGGGMGEVYLGVDEVLGRRVAIKAIRASMRPDRDAKTRFVREARLLSQLEHPNICRIYEFIEEEDCDFIVLELVQGRTLSRAIEDGLSPNEKMSVARQVAEALRAAHAMSVVHRDLKPENIMVGADGVVKVLDFGLARAMPAGDLDIDASGSHSFSPDDLSSEVDETSITELGHALGTPKYMSPEQARGSLLSAASDVYSFGLVLQELFTGRSPYPPNLGSQQLLAKAIYGDTLPTEGLGPELTRLIEDMKSLGPGSRPSVEAVAERLKWIDDRPRRRRRRNLVATVAALLVLAVVVSTLGFVDARRSQRAAEDSRAQAEAVNAFLERMLVSADPTVDGVEVKVVDVLDDAAGNVDVEFADRPLDRAAVLNTLAVTYLALGRYDDAMKRISSAYEIRLAELGPHHRDTLSSRASLGLVMYDQGDVERAEAHLRETFRVCTEELGPDDPVTLSAALNLARALGERGASDEAEMLTRQVVESRSSTLGPEAPATLTAKERLAVQIRRDGRYDEAEALHREILASKERVFGEHHPVTGNTLNNLASVLFLKGEFAEAEELYRRVVESRKERYGDEHPAYLRSLGNVAMTASRQGRFEEAERLAMQQIEAQRSVLGETHPETMTSENNLANTYRRWGKPEKAKAIYESVLERQRDVLGDEHPQTVRTLSNLAKVAQDMGSFDEAAELNRQVVEIRRRTLGDEHPFTLSTLYNLGGCLCQGGRFMEAEPVLRESYEGSLRTRGETDSLTILAANTLSLAMAENGRVDEAVVFIREQIEMRRERLGESDPNTLKAISRLAEILRIGGRDDEADAVEAELAALGSS